MLGRRGTQPADQLAMRVASVHSCVTEHILRCTLACAQSPMLSRLVDTRYFHAPLPGSLRNRVPPAPWGARGAPVRCARPKLSLREQSNSTQLSKLPYRWRCMAPCPHPVRVGTSNCHTAIYPSAADCQAASRHAMPASRAPMSHTTRSCAPAAPCCGTHDPSRDGSHAYTTKLRLGAAPACQLKIAR